MFVQNLNKLSPFDIVNNSTKVIEYHNTIAVCQWDLFWKWLMLEVKEEHHSLEPEATDQAAIFDKLGERTCCLYKCDTRAIKCFSKTWQLHYPQCNLASEWHHCRQIIRIHVASSGATRIYCFPSVNTLEMFEIGRVTLWRAIGPLSHYHIKHRVRKFYSYIGGIPLLMRLDDRCQSRVWIPKEEGVVVANEAHVSKSAKHGV